MLNRWFVSIKEIRRVIDEIERAFACQPSRGSHHSVPEMGRVDEHENVLGIRF